MDWIIENWVLLSLGVVGLLCLGGIGLLGVMSDPTIHFPVSDAEHDALCKRLNTKWLDERDL